MTSAQCPTCGGPIEFKIGSSFLVVCPHCKSAIARTDRALKDLGKVAALVDTQSPLAVGLRGKYLNVSFQLTGRAQLRHQAGGVWDEWYAAFSDGRWGWLAEAQGRFFMTFEVPLKDAPRFDDLQIGARTSRVPVPMVINEKGSAEYASAEGEIPFPLTPGEECLYADLSGEEGLFATLDYSGGVPIFYAGKEVALKELALDSSLVQPKEKKVAVANLACPHCGGALELRAPDETERVGCPHCGSLLDCTAGKLQLLQALKSQLEKPLLPLGSAAEFEGRMQTVIGFQVRGCVIDGMKYHWREYLLYNPQGGFRWLVHSDHHWTYVKAVTIAEIRAELGSAVSFHGETFKRFQSSTAVTEVVLGEFYWKVTIGETVATTDYVAPPRMLSSEQMTYEAPALKGRGKVRVEGGEISWSLGEYVEPAEIQKKFKLASLVRPFSAGACQPNPHPGYLLPWLAFVAASIVLAIVIAIMKPERDVVELDENIDPVALKQAAAAAADTPAKPPAQPDPHAITGPFAPAGLKQTVAEAPPNPSAQNPGAQAEPHVVITEPFELNAREMVRIEAKAPIDNAWLALECDLINEESGEVHPFDLDLEYYQGVDEGESWSEGSQSNDTYLSAVPAGKYALRMEAHWDNENNPVRFHVSVSQSSSRPLHLIALLAAISLVPVFSLIARYLFERRRWGESGE